MPYDEERYITNGEGARMNMATSKRGSKVVPVYEKLEPGSCYIISRSRKDLLVACNVEGKVEVKRVPIPKRSAEETRMDS